jgi:glycogen(starch) synthase
MRRARPVDILLVGPFPPPFGGISVHVRRLARLAADHGFSVAVLNHFRTTQSDPLIAGDLCRNPVRYWASLRRARARIVHYHHSRWSTLMATVIALAPRRSRPTTIITVHGHELDSVVQRRNIRGALTRWALTRFDAVVAVSPGVADSLTRAVPDLPVSTIPAYLPAGEDEQSGGLSDGIREFLAAGRPTLLVAAYRLSTDSRRQSIYGVDFAMDIFASLVACCPDLRLAIFLAKPPATTAERQRLNHLQQRASAQGLNDRVRIAVAEPLAPALAFDTVVMRPSTTDGDAVTIREALAAGRPVVASDVVRRPDGVRTLPLDRTTWREEIGKLVSEARPLRQQRAEPGHGVKLLSMYASLPPR